MIPAIKGVKLLTCGGVMKEFTDHRGFRGGYFKNTFTPKIPLGRGGGGRFIYQHFRTKMGGVFTLDESSSFKNFGEPKHILDSELEMGHWGL